MCSLLLLFLCTETNTTFLPQWLWKCQQLLLPATQLLHEPMVAILIWRLLPPLPISLPHPVRSVWTALTIQFISYHSEPQKPNFSDRTYEMIPPPQLNIPWSRYRSIIIYRLSLCPALLLTLYRPSFTQKGHHNPTYTIPSSTTKSNFNFYEQTIQYNDDPFQLRPTQTKIHTRPTLIEYTL